MSAVPSAFRNHQHSKTCTFEICLTGPTRHALIRDTLLRRLARGEEFLHYKRAEVEAMKFAPSALVLPPHSDPREGSSGPAAVDPGETRAVRASKPSRSALSPSATAGGSAVRE